MGPSCTTNILLSERIDTARTPYLVFTSHKDGRPKQNVGTSAIGLSVGQRFPLLHVVAQLLVFSQIAASLNLLNTVVTLALYYHQPSVPVPRRLYHIIFNIVAPRVRFDVGNLDRKRKQNENRKSTKKPDKVHPILDKPEVELNTDGTQSVGKEDDASGVQDYALEWQMLAQVVDRVLFLSTAAIVALCVPIAFIYLYSL